MKIAGIGNVMMALVLAIAILGSCQASADYQLFLRGLGLDVNDVFVNFTMNIEKLVINSTGGIVSVARIDGGLFKIVYVQIDKNGDRRLRDATAKAVFFATGGENISDQFMDPLYFGRYPGLDLVASLDQSGGLISEVFLSHAGVRIQQAGDFMMFYDARKNKLWHFGIVNPDGTLTEMTSDSLLGVSAFINATYTYERMNDVCNCE